MSDYYEVAKEMARPLITRYTRNFINLYSVLGITSQADIETIFSAYKSRKARHESVVEEAFYVLSSSFLRIVYDTTFYCELGTKKYSTVHINTVQKFTKSPTLIRRKKQTFKMMLIIGLILTIPTLFIDISIGSTYLGLIIFIWGALVWLLLSWYVSYVAISYFDERDILDSCRVRNLLWIEPSLEMAKYEITYIKSLAEYTLFTNSFILDEFFDFTNNKKTMANSLVIMDYWKKELLGWRKKPKIMIPIKDIIRIAERK